MGQLINDEDEVMSVDGDGMELADISEVTPEPKRTVAQNDEAAELPDKYRGKSVQEIIKMHEEAEKLIGRQGSEMGELRKLADQFILRDLEQKAKPVVEDKIDEVDFFANPKEAVAKAIESHPEVQAAKAASRNMKAAQVYAELERKYPGFENTVKDEEFQKWIVSSKVRSELFVRADQSFDMDAAEELLSTWNERKAATEGIKNTANQELKRQTKAASTGVVSNSGEQSSKKIYRRADIIKLMQTDPDRYEALQPEIQRAYAEKRVR